MKIVAKDITGEVYETPDMSKERLRQEFIDVYGEMSEEDVAHLYRVVVNSLREWDQLDTVTLNVGTLDEEDQVRLSTKNLIYVKVVDPIEDWEDKSDTAKFLDEPRFWN